MINSFNIIIIAISQKTTHTHTHTHPMSFRLNDALEKSHYPH